jgi:hypothetical protein
MLPKVRSNLVVTTVYNGGWALKPQGLVEGEGGATGYIWI